MTTVSTANIWLDYHAREADRAQRDYDAARSPIERASLLSQINWHRSQIRQIDRKAEAADKAPDLLRT